MNKQELQDIRERCEKATPGPWKWIINGNTVQSHAITTDTGKCGIQEKICASISPKTKNANFIAHARTDIPALLTEIDRLTAERDNKGCGWCNRLDEYDRFECTLINHEGSDMAVDHMIVSCIADYCPVCGRRLEVRS
ncbi:MAG: hypothetical protein AWM53_01995 [Candidatus Dichloromethanomonas elyunquensis]|nr:MAG: hypothetical protein AWM53_01995 [Candidatus Dichloromethanomonas elyunquensis]